ncbi:MAG: SIR2 family protein [Pseudomonadota bacterium]
MDKNTDGEHLAEFDAVREKLRYWPYTIHYIEDTLDIALIEGRARQLLFQAINSRSLTAFVGSGVSASYGRLSWHDWQSTQFGVVRESVDAFLKLADVSLAFLRVHAQVCHPDDSSPVPWIDGLRSAYFSESTTNQKSSFNCWRWFRFRIQQIEDARRQISGLNQTFRRTQSSGDDFPGGEALPLKFQISQQLHNQLRALIQIFLPPVGKGEPLAETQRRSGLGARDDTESSAPSKSLENLRKLLVALDQPQWRALKERYEKARDHYIEVFTRPQAEANAEDLTKMLLVDERAHAMLTLGSGLVPEFAGKPIAGDAGRALLRGLERDLSIYDESSLRRDMPRLRDNPDIYRVLSAFRLDALGDLRDRLESEGGDRADRWADFLDWERDRLEKYQIKASSAGDDRRFLTPSSRFLMATYLALHKDAPGLIARDKDGELVDDAGLLQRLSRDQFTSRRSIIADRFDPLAKSARRLGIRRYITTNYDFEIERFFEDSGYRRFPPKPPAEGPSPIPRRPDPTEYRSDPTGELLIDQTFDRKRASELVAFSVAEQGRDAGVFHLHGRATAEDRMVITEKDYMDLYLFEDEHRDSVNEAITMAFSSAPMVFLGLGMEEADLLRPLRQFMSNQDRTLAYQAVAILPGEKPIEARTKFSVTCFLRYGVHTIFYGSGRIKLDLRTESEKEDEAQRGHKGGLYIDWLCRVLTIVKTVKSQLTVYEHGAAPQTARALLLKLMKNVGLVDVEVQGKLETLDALSALYRLDHRFTADDRGPEAHVDALLRRIVEEKGELDFCEFTPVQLTRETKKSRHYSENVFIDGDDYVGFATGLLGQALRIHLALQDAGHASKDVARDVAALLITLDGLYGAFLTGALNAQLVGLEKEWRLWWKNWQQSPPYREARFQQLPLSSKPCRRFRTGRYVRHHVDSIITNTDELEYRACDGKPVIEGHGKVPSHLRESERTRVRAFDTFILALADGIADVDLHL